MQLNEYLNILLVLFCVLRSTKALTTTRKLKLTSALENTTTTATTTTTPTTTPKPTTLPTTTSFIRYYEAKTSKPGFNHQETVSTVTIRSTFDSFTWKGDCSQFNAIKVGNSCECRMKAAKYWKSNLEGHFLAHPLTHKYMCNYQKLPVLIFDNTSSVTVIKINHMKELTSSYNKTIREIARETFDERNPLVKEQQIYFGFGADSNQSQYLMLRNKNAYDPGTTLHMVVEIKPNDYKMIYIRLTGSKNYTIATENPEATVVYIDDDDDDDNAMQAVAIAFIVCFVLAFLALGFMIMKYKKARKRQQPYQTKSNDVQLENKNPRYVTSTKETKKNASSDDFYDDVDKVKESDGYEPINHEDYNEAERNYTTTDSGDYEVSPNEIYDLKNGKTNRKQPNKTSEDRKQPIRNDRTPKKSLQNQNNQSNEAIYQNTKEARGGDKFEIYENMST